MDCAASKPWWYIKGTRQILELGPHTNLDSIKAKFHGSSFLVEEVSDFIFTFSLGDLVQR